MTPDVRLSLSLALLAVVVLCGAYAAFTDELHRLPALGTVAFGLAAAALTLGRLRARRH